MIYSLHFRHVRLTSVDCNEADKTKDNESGSAFSLSNYHVARHVPTQDSSLLLLSSSQHGHEKNK